MSKKTTMFVCSSCGYDSQKWYGKCPECGSWNTFSEIKVSNEVGASSRRIQKEAQVYKIADVVSKSRSRISTGFEEFDRVLGGGIVPGEALLLSGDPGIGKSTLLLQVALDLASKRGPAASISSVLYISGEESEDQIKLRAERIVSDKKLEESSLMLSSTSDIEAVVDLVTTHKPTCVIVDSIQTMASDQLPGFPGSVPQIRYCTQQLVSVGKSLGIPIFLVGHVTKEGIVAGPMLLSHMVDAVLYLEGERFSGTRILRAFKNRFGDVSEVGLFMMEEKGLVEIKDASNFFMDKKDQKVPGSCASVIIEGSRPLLVEFQALTVPSSLSFPRRVVNGVSDKRVELLLAVIQKHLRIPLERLDVFVNVVGGLKVLETASDLAICLAVISSFKNKALPSTVALSEVGLLGELRQITQLEKRIKEAKKLGFSQSISASNFKSLQNVVQSIL